MTAEHDCIYEEQILGQSRKIERLEAHSEFKEQSINELKDELKEMQKTMNEINKNVNNLILKSNTDDSKLDARLVAIETAQQVQKEMTEKNRADFNLRLTILGIVFGALTIYLNFFK